MLYYTIKMKIVYVITKSNWGGAQRYVYQLATSLPKDKFEVVVAFGGTGAPASKPGLLSFKLHAAGIRTIFIENLQRDIGYFKEVRVLLSLYKLFKKEKPDVVHLNSSKIGGLGSLAARLAGVKKIVFTVHGWAFDEGRSRAERFLIKCASFFTTLFATNIIAISKKTESQALRFPTARKKTSLIYNGIDPESEKNFLSREEARKKIDVRENMFVVGTIAELTKNKGLNYLIEAASKLKLKINGGNFKLIIIGGGEEESELKALASSQDLANEVIFLGFRDNASQYLKAFDVFALSSVKEGLPYVLFEAGVAKLPVVVTNAGSIPEIVDRERDGLIVPMRNSAEIARALEELMKNPNLRSRLGENLYKKVTSKFTLSEMIRKTIEVYRK
jgi:glycosyltransferase involved in cell wall biosynthesis